MLVGAACGCGRISFDAGTGHGQASDAYASDADASDADASDADASDTPARTCGPFGPPERVVEVSVVDSDDWQPFITRDGLELYTAAERAGGFGLFDIWVYTRPSTSVPFGTTPINVIGSAANEQSPSLTEDGLLLFFEADLPGGLGGMDLWVASRSSTTEPFDPPVHLPEVSSASQDTLPFVTGDGLTLYFSSDRPGGAGGRDIWRATRTARSEPFAPPEPVVELNSPTYERGITLSADGLEAFFASERPGGASEGELDIWRATRNSTTEPFGPAINVVELNSVFDDVHPNLSADSTTLYYNHQTDTGGTRDADVWRATRTCSP